MLGGRDEDNASPLILLAIGAVLVTAGVLFHFLVMHFSRLREYYADANSAKATGDPRLLQRALARLHIAYSDKRLRAGLKKHSTTASLFIVNYFIDVFGSRFYEPSHGIMSYLGDIDRVVEELKNEKVSAVRELFSTHPPIPKRLRFLDSLKQRIEVE